jgi:hypothetical protein
MGSGRIVGYPDVAYPEVLVLYLERPARQQCADG